MSMSDDPRGFRRGQGGGRDFGPPSRGQQNQDKPQPAFSAYRPEAYANTESAQENRPEWDNGSRTAPQLPAPPSRQAPPPLAPQQPNPYSRAPAPSIDSYYQNAPSDPYASSSQRGYDRDWENETRRHSGAHQFPSYYPPSEDAALGPDAQSLHDRFFSSDPNAGDPLPAPPQGHYRNAFEDHNHGDMAGQGFNREQAKPYANEPAPVPRQPNPYNPGFDDRSFEWDQFDQPPPAPSSVRGFQPPAIADEDLDADFFADEDEYDLDDYEPEHKGGRKKLMAAILVGAVVVGGGLAYVYKSSDSVGGGIPSLISADNSPVKEQPSDPGGRDFPNGSKQIYDRLGDDEGTAATSLAGGSTSSDTAPAPVIVTTAGTLEERIENALKAQGNSGQPNADAAGETPNEPRTVKTVTFGPDGNPQPVESRTQRLVSNDGVNETLSSGASISTAQIVPPTNGVSSEQSDNSGQQQDTQIVAVASAQPQALEVSESAGGTGNYFVQMGAREDRDAAVAAFAILQQKYASLIGNYPPSVRKADLGPKGVWYRLLIGPVESKDQADILCTQLKEAGVKGCFPRKD